MQGLPVASALDRLHQDVFGGHEGQFGAKPRFHHFRIDHQSVGHIDVKVEHRVHAQEGLGNGNAAVGTVIQRPLHPLGGGGNGRVGHFGDHRAGQRAYALATHGVAFIGHGRRADLILFKRFFHLFERLKNPQIAGEFIGALGNTGKHIHHPRVKFPGIGLPADRNHPVKAEFFGNIPFDPVNFFAVTRKQFHKTGLCAGGSFGAEQCQ